MSNIIPFKFLKTFGNLRFPSLSSSCLQTLQSLTLVHISYSFIVSFLATPIRGPVGGSKVLRRSFNVKKNAFLGVKTRLHRRDYEEELQNSTSAFIVRNILRFFNLSMAEVTEISPWILFSLVRRFTALFVFSFSPTTVKKKGKF